MRVRHRPLAANSLVILSLLLISNCFSLTLKPLVVVVVSKRTAVILSLGVAFGPLHLGFLVRAFVRCGSSLVNAGAESSNDGRVVPLEGFGELDGKLNG